MQDNTNKNGDLFSDDENEVLDFVDPVPEDIPTDVVTDIKSGIFNLFISLYHNNAAKYGPVIGLKMSLEYIDSISEYFHKTLKQPEND
jgi:hypothetical protein